MNLISKLFKRNPKWHKDNRHIIVPAFEFKGVQYYQIDDYMNIPCQRALEAIRVYEEFDNRCSKAFLLAQCEAIDNAVNKGLLTEVARINKDIKDRLNMIYSPDLIINLASIVYFDENENPMTYEVDYNKKKVIAWREGGLDPFFWSLPLKELLPSLDFSKVDSLTITNLNKEIAQLTLHQIEYLLSAQCSINLSTELKNELAFQMETLKAF